MSSLREIKRQLEAAAHAIDSLDADLAAGRLTSDEHARQRAEREREAGRLFLILRQTQREAATPAAREAEPPPAAAAAPWWRSPLVLAPAAVVLLVLGVGGGVAISRWNAEPRRPAAVGNAPLALPPGVGSEAAPMSQFELQGLRLAVAREDAPIDSLLRLAHIDLDAGRLDIAKGLYDRVLAREPKNVEAITHQGGVLYQEGRVDEALAKVEAALRIDPAYVHAHWDRVQYLYHGKRDYPGTIKAGEAFLKVVPDGPDAETIRKLMAEARGR
jgi:tetratricopeptide (TPR) repeat protein